jgi:hypothetical protein
LGSLAGISGESRREPSLCSGAACKEVIRKPRVHLRAV